MEKDNDSKAIKLALAAWLGGWAALGGSYWKNMQDKVIEQPIEAQLDGRERIRAVFATHTITDTLLEGETCLYKLDGKEYKISIEFIDFDEVVLRINGQRTGKLKEGKAFSLGGYSHI